MRKNKLAYLAGGTHESFWIHDTGLHMTQILKTQKYFPGIMICLYLNLYVTQWRLVWLVGTKPWVMPWLVPVLMAQPHQPRAVPLRSHPCVFAHGPYLVSQTALVTQSLYFKECTKLATLINQFCWKPSHVVLGTSCSWLSQMRSFFRFHFMTV